MGLAELTGAEIWTLVLAGASALVLLFNAAERIGALVAKLRAPDTRQNERIAALEEKTKQTEKDVAANAAAIDELRRHHEADMGESREERQIIVYGLLACLKGLREQGCNDSVPKAIDKIEKFINSKAHEP